MKKLLLVLALASHQAHAQVQLDGNWWASNSEAIKTYFLFGYMQGYRNSAFIAPATICLYQKHIGAALDRCLQTGWEATNIEVMQPTASKPLSQFLDGVNVFYADYRNRSICFKAAIQIVTKNANGMSPEAAEEWAQKLRAPQTTASCD